MLQTIGELKARGLLAEPGEPWSVTWRYACQPPDALGYLPDYHLLAGPQASPCQAFSSFLRERSSAGVGSVLSVCAFRALRSVRRAPFQTAAPLPRSCGTFGTFCR